MSSRKASPSPARARARAVSVMAGPSFHLDNASCRCNTGGTQNTRDLTRPAEGVLDLAVGELVRPGLPVRDHAQPSLVGLRQAGQGLVHACQVRGPPVG